MGPNASFGLFLGGIVLVISGACYGAVMLEVPVPWIVVGGVILLGLGIVGAAKATRSKAP